MADDDVPKHRLDNIRPLTLTVKSIGGGVVDSTCVGGVADQVRFLWQQPGLVDDQSTMLKEALLGVKDGRDRLIEVLAPNTEQGTALLGAERLIQDIWLADGGLGPYPLLGRLAENQLDRVYYPFYRDHLVHQVRVWVLGLYLLGRVERLRNGLWAEVRRELGEDTDGGTVAQEALRRWKVASLWHDI